MRLIYPILFLLLLGCASPSTPSSYVEQGQRAEASKGGEQQGTGAQVEATETTRTGGQDAGSNQQQQGRKNEAPKAENQQEAPKTRGFFAAVLDMILVIGFYLIPPLFI